MPPVGEVWAGCSRFPNPQKETTLKDRGNADFIAFKWAIEPSYEFHTCYTFRDSPYRMHILISVAPEYEVLQVQILNLCSNKVSRATLAQYTRSLKQLTSDFLLYCHIYCRCLCRMHDTRPRCPRHRHRRLRKATRPTAEWARWCSLLSFNRLDLGHKWQNQQCSGDSSSLLAKCRSWIEKWPLLILHDSVCCPDFWASGNATAAVTKLESSLSLWTFAN